MLYNWWFRLVWSSRIGSLCRSAAAYIGVKFIRAGRTILKHVGSRCSWCGANCGFNSEFSSKGLRCCSYGRDCTNKP